MWYNLRPYCNGTGASLFGIGANATCAHKVLHHTIHPEDIELDHAKPLNIHPRQFWRPFHQHFGTPPWGWYSWGRRLQGTATIAEYREDVATFLDAALEYTRNTSATLVWLESSPQHFDRAGDDSTGAHCSQTPATPMAPGPWPPELEALCAASRALDMPEASSAQQRTQQVDGTLVTQCEADWRNHIARPLLSERGVAVVPLAGALSSRSSLHTGGGGDCTHWCEGSEATHFMAMSVLNTLATLLREPSSPTA